MKELDEVTERLATELNFLQEEGKAAMVYTIAHAPTPLLGIQLITKVFHTALCVVAEQSFNKEK